MYNGIRNNDNRGEYMTTKYQMDAQVFKAFADENRLMILELLGSGEKCACKLLDDLHISQSTLSHHMKILCDSGIVEGRKEGKWIHYSLNKLGCESAMKTLYKLSEVSLDKEL